MQKNIRGDCREKISLADYSSWRVGGLADVLFIPADISDLSQFLMNRDPNTPLTYLGLGSNVLIRDGGIRGVVIVMRGLSELKLMDDHSLIIRAEAGVSCAQLARFSARQNLTGLEFFAGIPGTVGGALAMNAGCFGGETWDQVHYVETIDRQGNIRQRAKQEFHIAYRSVTKPADEYFIAAYFQLEPGDKQLSLEKIREWLDRRNQTQPTNLPSCGSVFRNPPHDYAARLIEISGLKSYKVGHAQVSEKHANFIVNLGGATAKEIETLIHYVKQTVLQKQGILLQEEVKILGED